MVQNRTHPRFARVMEPIKILQLAVSYLEDLKIEYMVGGSFASSVHGEVRYTADADLVVRLKPEQVEGFARIFSREFYLDGEFIEKAVRRETSFNLVHLETMFKVDFFILGEGKFMQEEFSRRVSRQLCADPDIVAQVQTPEDCILSKLDWYRRGGEVSENQWRDVLSVLSAQSGRLDLAYLRKWAAELKVSDLLEHAFEGAGSAPANPSS